MPGESIDERIPRDGNPTAALSRVPQLRPAPRALCAPLEPRCSLRTDPWDGGSASLPLCSLGTDPLSLCFPPGWSFN